MKRFYLLTLPGLLLSQVAMAQNVRFGIKAGAALSKQTDASNPAASAEWNQLSSSGGLMMRYDLNSTGTVILQPELLYVGKGRRYVQWHYLELPVLARISLRHFNLPVLAHGRLDLNRFAVEAGPQVSTVSSLLSRHLIQDANSRRNFRRGLYAGFQLGYAAGLSYEVLPPLSLTLRYTNDITGVKRGDGLGGTRTSVFHVQVGYLLGGRQ
jgi:hypothetical protein